MKDLFQERFSDTPINRRPYTLVEILTVIVVVSILLGISLPAFQKLAVGQGVELAARTIGGKCRAARAYAIQKRKNIALLMPKENIEQKYMFNAYRTCEVDGFSGTVNFVRWVPGDKWEFLPTGVGVLQVDHDDTVPFTGLNPTDEVANSYVKVAGVPDCEDPSDSSKTLRAIVFRPNGKTGSGAVAYYIALGQGSVEGGDFTCKNRKGIYLVAVNGFTGRVSYETD